MGKLIRYIVLKHNSMSVKNKIVLSNAAGAFFVKGLSLLVSIFTTPAYIKFFNNNSTLGLWFTVLSVLYWIFNFDFGIGNGLRNHLATTIAKGQTTESKKYISSSYFSIGFLTVVFSIAFYIAFDYINWNSVFNISQNIISPEALLTCVKIAFIGVISQFFFRLISYILYAIQKSSLNNALTLIPSLIVLLAVCVIPSGGNDDNVVNMAIVHCFAVVAPLLLTTVLVFLSPAMKNIAPSIRHVSFFHVKSVLTLGGSFFFVQIMYMFIMSSNEYLLTVFTNSSDVVDYKIYNQIFTFGSTLFTLTLTPVWSAITKAVAENDVRWIIKSYQRMMLLAAIGTIAEFLIIPFLPIIINIWIGKSVIQINYFSAISFAVLGSLIMFNSVLSSVYNGMGKLKVQAISFGVGAVIKIPIFLWLMHFTGAWYGVVIATALSLSIYCVVQPFFFTKYVKRHSQK